MGMLISGAQHGLVIEGRGKGKYDFANSPFLDDVPG